MKTCNHCGESKPTSEYNKHTTTADKLTPMCKACSSAYHADWYLRNSEHVKAKSAAWQKSHPERMQEVRRKTRYGLTREMFNDLLVAQQGCCAICGVMFREGVHLHVDHDHSHCLGEKACGECVRALLCNDCNRGLGGFRDRCDLLAAACEYLTKHTKEKP